ncbi:hypothetical protein SAMD00079811_78350 (plasmid) [Scytonema sp. HK-05]|uniref:hypothetical protein n=1 Tax=Scytonema sp. HK-05 TaxID=1137095 RepID=UPI000936E696|nr:hypothetical protein [Scytonema sp. HK-05]OKH56563.1 hypothetical protein NIES2130_24745 [Scytonema sp. HK-05]BAY50206.1 hypothetical protein SAMD00079811_78350 [Scytonema sp. HK-05]
MIPKPQRDKQGRIQGEFYPLQKAELIALRKTKLINNAAFVHLALRYENPFCDRPITVIPKEFALRWLLPESSVYEAIAKLKENHAINIKSGKVTIEWVNSQQESDSENPENFWESRKNSETSEKIPETQKKFRESRNNSETSEKRSPKPLQRKVYKESQIYSDYSEFIQTLSESQRANFLNFCEELTKNLSQPVNDIEAWLAHSNKAGKNRWEVYYQKFLAKQKTQINKSKNNQSSRHIAKKFQQEIEEQRQQAMLGLQGEV